MSKPNKLHALAAQMRGYVGSNGQAHQVLGHGLHLVLQRGENGHCRLALGREAPATPSEQELAICAAAFTLPPEPARASRAARWRQPRTGRMVNFNVIELFWIEIGTEINTQQEKITA